MNFEALDELKANAAKQELIVKPRKQKQPRKAFQINMKVTDADILVERVQSIGLGTVGDVVQILVKYPEAIEALRPFAKLQMSYLDTTMTSIRLQRRLEIMQRIAPEKFEQLMKETLNKTSEVKQ